MNNRKRIALTIIFIITMAYGIKPVIAASPTQLLRVSPVILPIELKPGNATTYVVSVENLTDAPMPLSASIEGFDSADEEGGYTFNSAKIQSPLAEWIELTKPDMIIPAKTKHAIDLTVRIPNTVALGGYYAVLFLTPVNQSKANSPTVTPRIGILLLANIGVQDTKATADQKIKILNFNFTKPVFDQEPISWLVRAQDISLNYLSAKPVLTLKPAIGKPIRIEMAEKIILPGKIRRWTETRQISAVPYGIYQAQLAMSIGAGQQLFRENYLIVLPVKIILMSFGILIVSVYLIMKRKNIVKALKELIKR
jgi:hypothetical protein